MRVGSLVVLVLALALFCGCARQAPKPVGPSVMPLTVENAKACADLVEAAKSRLEKPDESQGKDGFARYIAAAYVAPLRGRWLVKETVALAVSQKDANPAAAETLKCLVYDPQLTAALTGRSFSQDEWRDMYVRAGLMDARTFDLLDVAASSREASQ